MPLQSVVCRKPAFDVMEKRNITCNGATREGQAGLILLPNSLQFTMQNVKFKCLFDTIMQSD